MCPACITSALLGAVSVSSTGCLTALTLKKFYWKSRRKHEAEASEQKKINIEQTAAGTQSTAEPWSRHTSQDDCKNKKK
jgi:hypothetical protein